MELKSVQWRCASTTSVREFDRGMEHLKSLDEKALKHLAGVEPAQWTRPHFCPRALTDFLVNKLSESFNSMIVKACERPRPRPVLWMLGQTHMNGWSRVIASQNGGSTSYIFPLRLGVLQWSHHLFNYLDK